VKGAQEIVTSGDNDNDRLQVALREVDSFLSGEPAERVKDFIHFTFAEEERRRRQEAQEMKETSDSMR
jgi:hypothetical protein